MATKSIKEAPPRHIDFFSQAAVILSGFLQQFGWGFGQTFKEIAGLRIDYFFTTPSIQILGYERIKTEFSDHYPILLEVKL